MSSQQPCASWAKSRVKANFPSAARNPEINCLGAFVALHGMLHARWLVGRLCPRQACWRRLVRRRLVVGRLVGGGLILGSLDFGSLVLVSLVNGGLVLARLVLEPRGLVVSSLDIGRLEDDRLAIGGLVPGRLVGLVPGRLVVGRLVIGGLVLVLASAGCARNSSRQSRGRSARDHRGRSARDCCPGAAAWVLLTRLLCRACEKPPTSPSLGRSRPWSASKEEERERPSSAESEVWHTHQMFPVRYAADCDQLAGVFVDHNDD